MNSTPLLWDINYVIIENDSLISSVIKWYKESLNVLEYDNTEWYEYTYKNTFKHVPSHENILEN